MNTLSLCNTCYKEIPAFADPFRDSAPMIYKVCSEHGIQKGKLEGDREFYDKFSTYERKNHYAVLIINVTDRCNIKCKHCFYPVKNKWDMDFEFFKGLVLHWKAQGFTTFIISGGDPTCWKYYFEAAEWAKNEGIKLSQLTNGVRFSDDDFWNKCGDFKHGTVFAAEMSVHPENITSPEIRSKQIDVLKRLKSEGLQLSCIMQNIDTRQHSSIEIDQVMTEIVDFMLEWRDVTQDFRIRPICFDAWGQTRTTGAKYHLSDLVKSLQRVSARKSLDLSYSYAKDIDNIYNQNFILDGMSLVTVCAANIQDLDIGYLNRGPFMLANDGLPYSVPHCIIINEGMDKGWYRGQYRKP